MSRTMEILNIPDFYWAAIALSSHTQRTTQVYTTYENAILGAASAADELFGLLVLVCNYLPYKPAVYLLNRAKKSDSGKLPGTWWPRGRM